MDDKAPDSLGVVELSDQSGGPQSAEGKGNTSTDDAEMAYYGKRQQLKVRTWNGLAIEKCHFKTDEFSETSGFYLSPDLFVVFSPHGRECLRKS
jgi:hypothetical protein